MDGLYDFLVENEKPGPSLPCNSVSEFRQDVAVGGVSAPPTMPLNTLSQHCQQIQSLLP
jgi:hypothetical protein